MSTRCLPGSFGSGAAAAASAGPQRLHRLEQHAGGGFRLYLIEDGSIVAALDGRRDDHDILVSMLFVTPERRRQGLARALVRALRERFPDCALRCGHARPAAQ